MAAGTDLFLTILVVVSLANPTEAVLRLGGFMYLQWAVPAILAFLYLVEAWVELRHLPALLWHTLQRILRPLGATLLGWFLLDGQPLAILIPGMILMGLVAWLVHGLSWGGKLRRFLIPAPSVSPLTHGLAEDTGTLALLVLAMEFPTLGSAVALVFLLLGFVALGPVFRIGAMGHHLFQDRVWGIVSPTEWKPCPELPSRVRDWCRVREAKGARGLPGMAWNLPGYPGLRGGWLLEDRGARFFAISGIRHSRFIPLSGFRAGPETVSDIHLSVGLTANDGSDSALFLQKDAPVPESHKW
jgi:hypothetical protein